MTVPNTPAAGEPGLPLLVFGMGGTGVGGVVPQYSFRSSFVARPPDAG